MNPKDPPISADMVRAYLLYEQDTGAIRWRRGARAGRLAGTTMKCGYQRVQLRGFFVLAHRVAWLLVTGAWPAEFVDHKNGVRSDNRWGNLRTVSARGNAENQRSRANSRVERLPLGVHRSGGRFRAVIRSQGMLHHLGMAATSDGAHALYLAAKRKLHVCGTI